jgi:putative tricarboxylic transport membrane protein
MIEILLIAVLGSLIGLAIGIIPGMGTSFIMIAAYGILTTWDSSQIIAFYVAVTMSSQFAGSVSALIFGLPGEVTSQPALSERNFLQLNGQIGTTVKHTAVASLIAVSFALGVTLLLWNLLPSFVYILRTEVKFILLCSIFLIAGTAGRNTISTNYLMVAIGIALGLVGFSYQGQQILTFDQWWLSGGIPVTVLLIGLIAVPSMLNFPKVEYNAESIEIKSHPLSWSSITRGTLIGSFVGLVPVIGNAITSNVAWLAERSRKLSTPLQRVSSAEAANNSGNVMVLLPLLMFGIPIVPSEMILYSLINAQGWAHTDLTTTMLFQIYLAAIISSLIGYALCGPVVKYLIVFVQKNYSILVKFAVAVAVVSVLYLGYQAYNAWFYLLSLVICISIGVLLRHRDFTPLLIGTLIAAPLINAGQVFYQLYF